MTVAEALEPPSLRRVFSSFPSGVTSLAALLEGTPNGLIVSSFTPVSLEPPMVLVCVAHSSMTWPVLSKAERLGVSVLAADQEGVCRQLSAATGDRFLRLGWRATTSGAVLIQGATAWFECSIEEQRPAGDHDIVVLRVHDLQGDQSVPPLVFHASKLRGLRPEVP